MPIFHTPVMLAEVIRFLNCRPGGLYVDGTIGGAGHAAAILDASKPGGMLFGVDRDPDALKAANEFLKGFGDRVRIAKGPFSKLRELIENENFRCADGILLDLGVSSYQLDFESRGFGFGKDGPLDMRMDFECGIGAADILKNIDEEELSRIIFEYGEERYSRRIAHSIVTKRERKPILTTRELADAVVSSIPLRARHGRIHPATRTFQALRIFVNDELGELERFLKFGPEILCPGGRLVIISYHSLEDRVVKNAFRNWEGSGGYKVLTKKVVTPSENEVIKNPRARSAKLRALERN